ncbi:MAG: carbonic anhydrase [Desulfobacteraceae bacterium]|nr:carbonic anhydrase [Desulfobacteraceae bacterium]
MKMPTPEEALKRLKDGNQRYVEQKLTHPNQTAERRAELSSGQYPYAVILGCSDSRVPPEVIFDQGMGDLFVIRVAGNIADDVVLGSIEYAAEHLHTPLIVVMGHSKCGAVSAVASGTELDGHLPSLGKIIQPAVDKAKGKPGDLVTNAAKTNAEMTADMLRTSEPVLSNLVKAGKVDVVTAYYDLDTGICEF